MTKYLYTSIDCGKCQDRKVAYKIQGIPYEERNANRLKDNIDNHDVIDEMAMVELAMQNMQLPVEVNTDEKQ